jgi:hypothetical protein
MVAYTACEDRDLALRIQPPADGGQVALAAREPIVAPAEVDRLLALR